MDGRLMDASQFDGVVGDCLIQLPADEKNERDRLRTALLEVHARLTCWLELPTGTRREDVLKIVLDALYPRD